MTSDPANVLLSRVRGELSASFVPGHVASLTSAPARIDVMGGIAEYTGAMVCHATCDRANAAAVITQPRNDRLVQIFSFDLLDEHKPFTFQIPLDALAGESPEILRRGFDEPGRQWAAPVAGCLHILHARKLTDLRDSNIRGMNVAVHSTIPAVAGLGASAAITAAAMVNFISELLGNQSVGGIQLADLCREVGTTIVGKRGGMADYFGACSGEHSSLLRMLCQPALLLPPLPLPTRVCVLGIDSGVRAGPNSRAAELTRGAASMGHKIIFEKMREMGQATGRSLRADPMNGYLANLVPDDYKKYFRPFLPEFMPGRAFLDSHGHTIDSAESIDPDASYPVQHAVDHHVLEAMRVRRFVEFLEEATRLIGPRRKSALDRAGHLMYASHLSYTNDAMLGSDACDVLVKLVREYEYAGLYGARITAGGRGGTVAVLLEGDERATAAVEKIVADYHAQTGYHARVIRASHTEAGLTATNRVTI